jgi:predicted lipid-binding transport protein (Tim44 family)
MDAGSGFPIDLVLFGLVAAFLVLRLRSILGRRTGYERPPAAYQPTPQGAGPVIEGKAEPVAPASAHVLPDPAGPVGQTLARIRGVDRTFDPAAFLDGAEKAFSIIVGAFAAGDRATLRPLLSDDTYRAFDGAIAAREAAGQTQLSELRAIQAATIETAELTGTVARLTVRFVSDQISLTRDAGGQPVHGTDAVTELVDLWSFERDMTSRDPIWRLIAAASA